MLSQIVSFMKNCVIIHWITRVIINGTILSIPIYMGMFLFQAYTPPSYWFEYQSVEAYNPNGTFQAGEPLEFRTLATRYKDLDTQYQDTLYCYNGERTKKYPTAIAPPNGYELRNAGEVDKVWALEQQPDIKEKECSLCYNTVGVTSLWIRKVQSGCSKWFNVNGNTGTIIN